MLGEDEIRHIFSDEEEEIQAGDIVSALWLPNGQFYDAKVLQKGGKFCFTALISATRSQYCTSLSDPKLKIEGHLYFYSLILHVKEAAGFAHLANSHCRVHLDNIHDKSALKFPALH